MSKFKFTKVLLLTPGIGSVAICLVSIATGVALLSIWARPGGGTVLRPGGPGRPAAVLSRNAGVKPEPAAEGLRWVSMPAKRLARHKAGFPKPTIFQKPIASDELGFLSEYAGRAANDVVHDQKLRKLVNQVVPYAPFHLGLDLPLPVAIEGMLANSEMPVEIRNARYVMFSGRRGPTGRGRGFIWIDMQEGIALGGIFFFPSNGEPTPTLTLFSKQVNEGSLGMSQLPLAFAEDLGRWAATEGVPPITTRYLINASNEKVLLAHDEDVCKSSATLGEVGSVDCNQIKTEAAEIDMKAALYLQQTQYASNATMRMAFDRP